MDIEIKENEDGSYSLQGEIDGVEYNIESGTNFEILGIIQIHFFKDLF